MQHSERLGKQIEESTHRLSEIDNALEAIAADLLTKAGEQETDSKGIAKLIQSRSALQSEREFLNLRLIALTEQRQQAAKNEAQERVKAILIEADALHRHGQKAAAGISALMTQLEEAIRVAFVTRQQQDLLRDEARFLALSHDVPAPSIDAAPLPGEQLGQQIQTQLEAGQRNIQQATEWQRKTQALKEERHHRTAAQDAPRHATYQKHQSPLDSAVLEAARAEPVTLPLVKRLFAKLGSEGKAIRIGEESSGEPMSEPRETKLRQLQGRD